MRDSQALTVNETDMHAEAQAQAEQVTRRVATELVHREIAMLGAMRAE